MEFFRLLSNLGSNIIPAKASRAPKQSPSILDIAWAAGIYEGEGSTNGTYQLNVIQKDPELLYKLERLFGGKVYPRTNGKYDPLFVWCLGGSRARGFAMSIFSFLTKRRREQVKRLIVRGGSQAPSVITE